MRVAVKAVGTVKLEFRPGVFYYLEDVYYIPSMRRNLISVSVLVKKQFSFLVDFSGIKITLGSQFVGHASFINDYWVLPASSSIASSASKQVLLLENVNGVVDGCIDSAIGSKRKFSENSAYLWHRRLGHVSKERLLLLVKQGILPKLDFSDLTDCIECVKGKYAKQKKKTATRSTSVLQLVHTDICGPFATQTLCGNKYFITFIDDYTRFCHVYLISEKAQALEKFKIYKAEVEKELNTVIKTVRSDRGGEFYGRYTELGQHKGPFALFLQEQGIQAHYTTPGTPEQNGVAERRNRTFMNMVRCMMCTSGLPGMLWGEALKTANYLTNRTPSKAVSKTPFELWKNRKPSVLHTHVWGCKAEARPYNPQESKLDSKTVSAFFIGYPENSKGFKFYCPTHTSRVIETNKAVFIDEVNFTDKFEDFEFDELPEIESDVVDAPISEPIVVLSDFGTQPAPVTQNHAQTDVVDAPLVQEPANAQPPPQPVLRRSQRDRRSALDALAADFQIYLQEADFDIGEINDPLTFKQAIESERSHQWEEAMVSELKSMHINKVWTLVELPENHKAIGCKWVFKTKTKSDGSIERFKARLVAKGFTQQEGIDFNETFSPVSTKDAFRVVMALVAHYDMELHQMDVKTAFLNGELEEEIYMKQPEGFIEPGTEKLVCKLNRSIYGLKQASRQWYLKFDAVVSNFGFKENQVDECVYMKIEGKNFIFLILYVDDILLASTSLKLLKATKDFLSKKFDMKDLGEASYVLGIEIKRDRTKCLLGLSQQGYINKVLKRFDMQSCANGEVPMSKGDKLTKEQCPQNDIERENMKTKPYAQLVGSLMYAQVCTRPDLAYAVGILSRFQSNPGPEHWIAGKKILRYLQRTKDHLLVYRRVKELEVVGYCDSDFASHFPSSKKSTSGYVFTLAGGAIAWRSVKQTLIATSTMQAEFIAIYEAVCEGLWLKNFLVQTKAVDSIVSKPLKFYCDNSAAVFFTRNNKRSTNSKHIDLKYYSVRERVKHREIEVLKIGTDFQLADPFTKAMTVAAFKQHATEIGILPNLDA
ncbi:putative RNA-directed DNA polymerase [Rosa chinensis]|uniref:Putative RNA-directed DNA polymerase n=1 Tax=Rosa chinensis TaxID=74649 RepID=A0A2P6PZL6_ROSCH|nr:putative RNA-directed DNA polymerase [Rosa chinensis]